MKGLVAILGTLLLVGCAGEFDVFTNPDDDSILLPAPPSKHAEQGSTSATNPVTEPERVALEPGFEVHKDEVRLLPFHIRLQKLSQVTGLATDDPMFDELRRNRYDLGDHSFAEGIGADLSWNATKISVWVRGLQPICASEAMASRYPNLPEQLNELLVTAYGREVSPQELAVFEDTLAEQELSDAGRYEAVCLSVLTSSEFVAQ